MNLLLVCLLLPVSLAAPRVDIDSLRCDVHILLGVAGSYLTEQACKSKCHHLRRSEGVLFNNACPMICLGLMNFAKLFNEEPNPGDLNMICRGRQLSTTSTRSTTAAMSSTVESK